MYDLEEIKSFFKNFKDKPFRKTPQGGEYQEKAIKDILNSDKRIIILQAPTGAGKSLIGAIVGKIWGNIVYLVHSKALQHQIINDFPEFECIMGANNYRCKRNLDLTCDECRLPKREKDCPYKQQKLKTLRAGLRILNYTYFLTEANFVGEFSGIENLICDEADELDRILENFIELTISKRILDKFNLSLPKYKTASSERCINNWKEWANNVKEATENKLSEVSSLLDKMFSDGMDYEKIKRVYEEKRSLKTLIQKLNFFINWVDNTWIQEEYQTKYSSGIKFSPTWITPEMTQEYLLKHIKGKILLMSATFPPVKVYAKLTGLPFEEIDYFQLPYIFPIRNRPIYIEPAGNLSYKTFNNEIPKIIEKIDEIINKYPNQKGIIHCVSYKLVNEVLKNSKHKDRFITHNTIDRSEKLKLFKQSPNPLIMLSPSMERGVSLDNDYARFIIYAKAPFESLANKKTSARLHSGKIGQYWYISTAIQNLIQGVGRGMRNENDYCDVYLIDKCIEDLIIQNISIFPDYFKECIK